jgi:hypothetical protein
MMRRPETEALNQRFLERAYERAALVLNHKEINPLHFTALYGAEYVRNDIAEVERLEKRFSAEMSPEDRENAMLAQVFEAIIHEEGDAKGKGVGAGGWFGPEAHTIASSRYDDIKHGVDTIIEFRRQTDAAYLGLAVDVTFSTSVEDKLRRIRDEVKSGELTRLKYFESEFLGFRGELSGVPRVVVGVERKTVQELVEQWMEGNTETLKTSQVQHQLLFEIQMQLEAFEKYAESHGKTTTAGICARGRAIVEGIIRSKKPSMRPSEFELDEVFHGISRYMMNFKV